MSTREGGGSKHKEIQRLRRELQSRLDATKDKKEKKLLEAEYKEKIANLKKSNEENTSEESAEYAIEPFVLKQTDVSRSEKRRNRTTKDREVKDKLELAEFAKTDLSEVESKKLEEVLQAHKLKVFKVPSDGNCLFRSISHQLSLRHEINSTYRELRKLAAEQFNKERDNYSFLIDDFNESNADGFATTLAESDEYGGELEIKLISDALKLPIFVYQDTGVLEYNADFPKEPLQISFHKHLLSDCHYNSLVPIDS